MVSSESIVCLRVPPQTIVVDSTIFGDPPNPQESRLKQLGEYARQTNSRICVPAVVEKECKTRITEATDKVHREIVASARRLRKLGVDDIPEPDIAVLRDSALQLWDSRLSELGVQIIPTPDISHDEVIDKLHAGASPFIHTGNRREDGYRDYLVWRSAIDAAAHARQALRAADLPVMHAGRVGILGCVVGRHRCPTP